MARRRGRWARQAALESLLRFGPEISGLTELQRAAESQFSDSVQGARASARGTVAAVRAARPEVRQVYSRAGERVGNINAVLGDSMASAPASLQAAMAQEQAGFGRRLEESRADALTGLTERAVGAREGKGAAIRAARDEFAGTLQQVLRRRMDLAREQGTFAALRTGELRQAAQERADQFAIENMRLSGQERRSLRSSGVDPDTGRPIPGGRLDPDANRKPGDQGRDKNGKKWLPPASQQRVSDRISAAIGAARTLKQEGRSRREAGQTLLTGRPSIDLGEGLKTVSIKSTDQLLARAALDMTYQGYMSPATERLLRKRGVRVRNLGLKTYAQYKREQAGLNAPGTTGLTPGPGGQIRPG